MRINYEKLIKGFEADARKATVYLRESFEAKEVKADDFDFGRLFEACFGWEEFRACRSDRTYLATKVMEGAGAITTNAFQVISGQVVFNSFMEAYLSEDFVFTKLIPTRKTDLSGEKIPGISELGDQATVVNENEPFPLAGVGNNYIETPDTLKRGLKVAITKEAIFFDRTGLVLERSKQLGKSMGINKEKRAIDCVVDENTTAARYKWRGNTIATYDNNTGNHTWDNLSASTGLVDHTDIDACEQLFANMLDPDTGEPIMVMADTIIVTPQLVGTAWRVLNSIMVSMQAGGFATTGDLYRTDSLSPVGRTEFSAPYKLVTSRLLPTRMATDTSWFLGKPSAAFAWMENWPMAVIAAPANSQDEFDRDIVQQFRASERGAFATIEPRHMVKATA